ncbi:MAG: hypothetical protein GY714_10595 [Desulfobacterales bacterium]|nr:hypothetical protein [Desulfobacterales bacterium]
MAKSAKGLYLIQNKTLHKIFNFADMPYQENKDFWLERIGSEIGRKVTGLSKLTLYERREFIESCSKDFGNLMNPYVPPKHRDWQKGDKDAPVKSIVRPIEVPKSKLPLVSKIKAILTDLKRPWGYADSISKQMFQVDFVEHCDIEQLHDVVKALVIHQNRLGRKYEF